ncbi:MAG: response regulator [Verrucomicrobia bacterium]|nr:response regulator [Verrucomicrobiota bacterium]
MPRILVIDDDAGMREMLEQTLRLEGYDVVSASDGREGVEAHRASPADLVITDLFMPTQEGMETIAEFRKDFPEVPIIAICGRPGAFHVLRLAKHLGAVDTLAKPFQADELLAMVKKAMRSHL